MKLNSFSVVCLSVLLLYSHFSLVTGRGTGRSSGRSSSSGGKKTSTSNNRGSTHTSHKTGHTHHHHHHDSSSHGASPQQPGQTNQGGNPPRSGGAGNQGGGGYQYPARGSPYGGGFGGHGGHGSHGHGSHGHGSHGHGSHGGQGSYGGFGGQGANTGLNYGQYGGGYINQNPNRIMGPHYSGSFGYGAYGGRSGSPFSHTVQRMGVYPSDKSRGYGQSGAMAAAKGAVVGAAMGYGVGRFQRPHFHFRNRNEENYYNRYMYKKYGTQSTDDNDYSRDYKYSQPAKSYDNFMDSCMREIDLREEDQYPKKNPDITTKATVATVVPDTSNTTLTNSTAADNSSSSSPSTSRPLNESEAIPAPPDSRVLRQTATDFDDDDNTVSIMVIGYPALINQVKARRCVEKYMVYSEKYLKKNSPSTSSEVNRNNEVNGMDGMNGVNGVMGSRRLLAVVMVIMLLY